MLFLLLGYFYERHIWWIIFIFRKTLGVKVNLQTAGDYTGVISAMQHNHVQIAYFGPKSYVEAQKEQKLKQLL